MKGTRGVDHENRLARVRKLLIGNEFWHLAHDVDGRALLNRRTLPIGLASALLAELLDAGCVTIDGGLVSAAGQPYDAASAHLMAMIREARVHPVPTWLSVIGGGAQELLCQRLDALEQGDGRVPANRGSGLRRMARFWPSQRTRLSPTAMRLRQSASAQAWSTPCDAALAALAWATELDTTILRGCDSAARRFPEDSLGSLAPEMRALVSDTYRTIGMIGVSYLGE